MATWQLSLINFSTIHSSVMHRADTFDSRFISNILSIPQCWQCDCLCERFTTSTASWSGESVWSTRAVGIPFICVHLDVYWHHASYRPLRHILFKLGPSRGKRILIEQWKLNLSWTCHVRHTDSLKFMNVCVHVHLVELFHLHLSKRRYETYMI